MKKHSNVPKSRVSTRERAPLLSKDDKGNVLLLCPFCTPPHPINPDSSSLCGTILQVRALQTVYRAKKYDPKAVCVKCGKGGGEMVVFQGALIHTHDCTPGVVALSTPPKYSSLAKITYKLKEGGIKNFIQKIYGNAMAVEEVMPNGEKTGVIFGFFFNKTRGSNGRSIRESKPAETLPAKPVS